MAIDAAHPVPPDLPRNVGWDQIPAHVPKDLVFSTGITVGPEFLKNPHNFLAAMHENYPPIFYDVGDYINAWLCTKHEDCLFVLRHPEIFSNEGATPFPRDPNDYFYFIPIEIDPPHHRKYRNIVDPLFCPAGVKTRSKTRADASSRPISVARCLCRSSSTSWACRSRCATPSSRGRWTCCIPRTA